MCIRDRNITLNAPLQINRNMVLDGKGDSDDGDHKITGEVIVGSAVTEFSASNIEIDTLTLNGGGTDSVNLLNAVINILNINAGVSIKIDESSSITEVWAVSYTHLDVYKRQSICNTLSLSA